MIGHDYDPELGEDPEEETECPECDSELDPETGECVNELCGWSGAESDWQARQEERKQLGIGG